MGNLIITNINRNVGALTQQYRIEWKKPLSVSWTAGPTLSYDQAQNAPAGLLPVSIILDPAVLMVASLDVRIVTICKNSDGLGTENPGPAISVTINSDPCIGLA